MFYYKLNDKLVISKTEQPGLMEISENEASRMPGIAYALNRAEPGKSRRSFSVSDPSLLFLENESLKLLKKMPPPGFEIPKWLDSKIESREVMSVNTSYPGWADSLEQNIPERWRVNIAGLGDVGGTLLTGLRLLGGKCISSIGLYDTDENKIKRWVFEACQIYSPFDDLEYPKVHGISLPEVFDCDMFIFCVSVGVPSVGSGVSDVRMAQFEGNSHIIKMYAKTARRQDFKGIFAVVSDPVDLLCKTAFIESNTLEGGSMDFKGLYPEQIRGYGLGVMNARAAYYASQGPEISHYIKEGRAFGPHGEGLVIADSIQNYNNDISIFLTEKARHANMEIREAGFKPYVAPALSSGALPLIAAMRSNWHYSATFMGGVFMGSKNRLNKSGTEVEALDIPSPLWNRLKETYERLENAL